MEAIVANRRSWATGRQKKLAFQLRTCATSVLCVTIASNVRVQHTNLQAPGPDTLLQTTHLKHDIRAGVTPSRTCTQDTVCDARTRAGVGCCYMFRTLIQETRSALHEELKQVAGLTIRANVYTAAIVRLRQPGLQSLSDVG
nr:hypothetical protein CFP56_19365 [Quercus suber]